VVATVVTVLFSWWSRSWTTADLADYSRIQPAMFQLQGTILTATILAAFAIGYAASAFIRRTVPAMAVALAGFVTVTFGLRFGATHLVAPKTLTFPFGNLFPRNGLGDWHLGDTVIDHAGNTITQQTLQTICPAANRAGGIRGIDIPCVTAHGYQFHSTYMPLNAFWPLQTMETSILIAIAVALIAAASWQIIRRTS
jgi:hypothetical protein